MGANVPGRLSESFSIACELPHEPFGGLPVIFVSDMIQKGPCGVKPLTTDLMKYVQGELEEPYYKAVLNELDTFFSHRIQGCCSLSLSLLTKEERSKDSIHNNFHFHIYNGHTVTLDHIKLYELYNAETLKKGVAERRLWLEAPVICKTNRERYIVNYVRASVYAYETGNVVIRW